MIKKLWHFFSLFYPTASATAYGQRPKFFRAEHSATAEGENCAYGPTLGGVEGLGGIVATALFGGKKKTYRIPMHLKARRAPFVPTLLD